MKSYRTMAVVFGLSLWFIGEALAGGSKWSQAAGRTGGAPRGGSIARYWRPAPVARYHPFPHYYQPYYYPYFYGQNPRSVVIITPSAYYPYYGPVSIVTSEPFYCHMHHVGFVSRVGFLDHISGTHKIPLETANSICTDSNESCIIEGY
jgi:hypothetical protein